MRLGVCGSAVDYNRSFRIFRLCSDGGDSKCMVRLAMYYLSIDKGVALRLLARAAHLGDDEAIMNLGVIYARGDGVKKDLRMSRLLYGIASFHGNMLSKYSLGVMLVTGEGGARCLLLGCSLIRSARNNGHPFAWRYMEENPCAQYGNGELLFGYIVWYISAFFKSLMVRL